MMKTLLLFLCLSGLMLIPAYAGVNLAQPVHPQAIQQPVPGVKTSPVQRAKQVIRNVQQHNPLHKLRTQIESKLRIAVICAIAALILSVASRLLSLVILGTVSYVLWIVAIIFLILWLIDYV